MLVSIIINNYNYGRFLLCAINSALSQTYQNVEVIIVDDGSTDNSREIIESFGTRIKAILKQNGGQASAFNAGFGASRGDLILFLDSDDTLSLGAVERVAESWRRGMSKLHFPLHAIDEKGNRLGMSFPKVQLDEGDVLPRLLKSGDYCTPPTSGNVFSREFLESVMPIPEGEWRDCADCYVVQTAPFYGKIGLVPEMLGEYRLHNSSLTSQVKDGRVRINSLHLRLKSGTRKQRLLDRFSRLHGFEMQPNAVIETRSFLKLRLVSLKISPSDHPIEGDSLLLTLRKLISVTVRNRDGALITKLAYLVWALAITALPARLSELLAIPAFSPCSGSRLRAAIVRH